MYNNTFSMLEKRKSETRVLTYMYKYILAEYLSLVPINTYRYVIGPMICKIPM